MTPHTDRAALLEAFQAQLKLMITLADDAQEFLIAATLATACDHVGRRLSESTPSNDHL